MWFAFDRAKDDATALSSPPWRHIVDGQQWVGLMDLAHIVQAGECVCSGTDCGYVFLDMGADIILLAFSNWHTQANNPFTGHVTALPGLQRREHCCSHHFGLP